MRTISVDRLRLVAVLAGVNLVLIAGGWFALVAPQRHHAAAATKQTQQTQTELALLRAAAAAAIAASHSHLPRIQTADIYRLAQAMPTAADEPDLLLGLDQLAHASGVRVLGVSPEAPVAAVGYTMLPVSLSLAGNYGSLTRFLHRLRALVSVRHGKLFASGRLVSVTSVALTPGPTPSTETAAVGLDAYAVGTLPGLTPPVSSTTSTDTTSTTTTTGG